MSNKSWRGVLLDQVEGAVREKFFEAVEIRREEDADGEMRLSATWPGGGGAFVRLPAGLPVTTVNAHDAIEHVVGRLWDCAPIVGSC